MQNSGVLLVPDVLPLLECIIDFHNHNPHFIWVFEMKVQEETDLWKLGE